MQIEYQLSDEELVDSNVRVHRAKRQQHRTRNAVSWCILLAFPGVLLLLHFLWGVLSPSWFWTLMVCFVVLPMNCAWLGSATLVRLRIRRGLASGRIKHPPPVRVAIGADCLTSRGIGSHRSAGIRNSCTRTSLMSGHSSFL